MIVILLAIVGGSLAGALLAWMQAASVLGILLGYIAGGWIGLLVALAFLMLRPDCGARASARPVQGKARAFLNRPAALSHGRAGQARHPS